MKFAAPLAALTLAAAGLAGCATPPPADPATARSTAAAYMPTAASSDQFEIQSSRAVLDANPSVETRRFAEMMIAHHAQTTATLVAAARQAGLTPPPPLLNSKHAAMVEQIRSAPVGERERVYLRNQVLAHEEALALHSGYAQNGDRAELRTAASSAVPIVRQHLEDARRLSAQRGG